jgi:hypothetical protein
MGLQRPVRTGPSRADRTPRPSLPAEARSGAPHERHAQCPPATGPRCGAFQCTHASGGLPRASPRRSGNAADYVHPKVAGSTPVGRTAARTVCSRGWPVTGAAPEKAPYASGLTGRDAPSRRLSAPPSGCSPRGACHARGKPGPRVWHRRCFRSSQASFRQGQTSREEWDATLGPGAKTPWATEGEGAQRGPSR